MKITIVNDCDNNMDGLIYSSEYVFYDDDNVTKEYICREDCIFERKWEQHNIKIFDILSRHFNESIIS